MPNDHPFTPDLLERTLPDAPDRNWKGEPDAATVGTIRQYLADVLAGVGRILDLGSGPDPTVPGGNVIGLERDEATLRSNRGLSGRVRFDPERHGTLPFRSESFDAAVLVSRLQYLIEPIDLFREVRRVLRGGAPFVVVLTARGRYPDPVAIWLRCRNMRERMELGMAYFRFAGGYTDLHGVDLMPGRVREEDAVLAVAGRREGVETTRPDEPAGWKRPGRR